MAIVSHPANKNYRDNYPFKDKFEEELKHEKEKGEEEEESDLKVRDYYSGECGVW
jgi:hypothetical protein